MQITLSDLTAMLVRAAEKFVSPDEAQYFAELYVQSHIKKAPRMNPLQEAVDDLKNWRGAESRQLTTLLDKPGFRLFDFNGLAPSLKIKELHDTLEQKARANGLAALGFRNSGGIVTLGMWADGLAQRGLIGLAMFNGGAGCVTPYGGSKGVLGTNPLAYSIPGKDGPISLDMATSQIPYFQIKNAKQTGVPLPPGAAVDNEGLPTQNAAEALDEDGVSNLLPMGGGFKGYGIMMLVEILTGALIQSPMSQKQSPGWHPTQYGCFLLALDPGTGDDSNRFASEVSELGALLKAQPPAKGGAGVSLPGHRGLAKLDQAREQGSLKVDDNLLAGLTQ
jgi:ureidoglycolate dehydrogenase (NAD+)